MRGLVPVALLVGLLLSGCVSDDPKDSPAEETPLEADFSAADDNATAAPVNDTNAAPTIGGFESNVTGLNVTFTFNATDADGDNLTYTLAFGGNETNATGALVNGTGNLTHAFAEAGLYNVTLTVSDGTLSANLTLALNLTAAATAGAPEEFTCTVDAPAVVVSISGLPIALGACVFTTTSTQTLLVLAEPAAGCTIRLDEDPSDTTAGPVVQEGSVNPPGEYGMRCDIQGPSVGGEGRIIIQAM